MSSLKDMNVMPSAYHEDWSREKPRQFWDPSRKLLKSIRTYQRLKKKTSVWALLLRKLCVIRHRFWSVVTGAEIQLTTSIGGGLMIPHPNGIVIHPRVEIGSNCMIFQQVTLGATDGGEVPKLGGNVLVGAGAKVLGAISVSDNVQIGANAVVLSSVSDGETVVGIPAKVAGHLLSREEGGVV